MIKLIDVLNACEYDRVLLKVRVWNKEGIQEVEDTQYVIRGEDGAWRGDDLDIEICGYKWRGELDQDCPVLCINRGTHWVEFDPKSRKAIDICQIGDGYQAYLIRKGRVK